MTWSKPDFVEISLCMEVTAYVNTDDETSLGGDEAGSSNDSLDRAKILISDS
jgi:coenzyme PQQ precursor peptide PqqA